MVGSTYCTVYIIHCVTEIQYSEKCFWGQAYEITYEITLIFNSLRKWPNKIVTYTTLCTIFLHRQIYRVFRYKIDQGDILVTPPDYR